MDREKAVQLPRKRRQTRSWGPLSAVLVTIGIYFGAQLGAGLAIGIYSAVAGINSDEIGQKLDDSVIFQFAFVVLAGILTLVLLRWFMRHREITFSQIGLGRWPVLSDLPKALATFGLYFITLLAVMSLVGGLFTGLDLDQKQQIGFDSVSGFGPLLLVFASLVLLPPIVEEILIRGFLYSGLKNKFRPLRAALIASFIFAVAHLQFGNGEPLLWVAAIDTFVLSMFLIRLREKTGSLWAGIGVHFAKNCLAFVSLFVLTMN